MHVLFEHAVGYALFAVKEFEEISSQVTTVEKSIMDKTKFKSLVDLVSFSPHKSASSALENALFIAEGDLHQDLELFLDTNLPKSIRKAKTPLGVADPKIGTTISERFGIICQSTDVVNEILRGVRYHLHSLVNELTPQSISAAELSLGRNYSRSKIKFNVKRADNMIIQSISLLDQLDKDINTFNTRLREWYSYHFPELFKIVPDPYKYAKISQLIGDRKEIDETITEELNNITQDPEIDASIISAAKSSMGMDISPIDIINISAFSSKVINLMEYRHQLMDYLISRMKNIAPNLSTLVGETVGARLICHAGSLINLAKYPASTVQILGAEKALFRALRTRGKTPKHGLLFNSSFISRAMSRNKGRISRFLANKCSIASRIDCFAENQTDVFGTKLKDQVEERLIFYENGQIPKKNVEVMKEAMDEAKRKAKEEKRARKKARREKRRLEAQQALQEQDGDASMNPENSENNLIDGDQEERDFIPKSTHKKRKMEKAEEIEEIEVISPKKKKKERKREC